MPAGRTNKFAKARQHLRSTHLDEKIQMLSEIPTNNTGTFFVVEPDVFETIPAVRAPLDLTADDASLLGKDTSGLFDASGDPLTEMPPGDTSYILGPMVSVFFPDGDYTAIGYIQKDTRKVVNLARIPGPMSGWGVGGNVEGFTSYSQLTVEQALWYRDKLLNGNTSSYRVFYIGVFEQLNSETDVTDPSTGVDIDEFGRWLGEIISDGFISEPERQELIKKGKKGADPDMPSGIANPLFSLLSNINPGSLAQLGARLLRSFTDSTRYAGDYMFKGLKAGVEYLPDFTGAAPKSLGGKKWADVFGNLGRTLAGNNYATQYFTPSLNKALDYAKSGGTIVVMPRTGGVQGFKNWFGSSVSRGFGYGDIEKLVRTSDTIKSAQQGTTQIFNLADPKSMEALKKLAASGSKANTMLGKLGRAVPFVGAAAAVADVGIRLKQGDYAGAILGGASAIPGPIGWGALGLQVLYDTAAPKSLKNYLNKDVPKFYGMSNSYKVDGNLLTEENDPVNSIKQALFELGVPTDRKQFAKEQGTYLTLLGVNPDLVSILTLAMAGEELSSEQKKWIDDNLINMVKVFSNLRDEQEQNPKTQKESNELISESRQRILRDLKKPYTLPEAKKEKIKHRPKVNKTGIKSVGDGLMKQAEVPTSFKRIEDTMWKKQERAQNTRFSQERKNMILDSVGTADHAWEYITDRSASGNESKMYEHFGQGIKNRIIEKKKIGNDYIIKMYNEEGKVETVTQSVLNERLQKQHELVEQETIRAPKDPLIARIKNKLYSQIDYPDKPAKLGYPDEPPKQMVGGYHPEFGDRHAYYNRLDRHSADTMQNAPTQDPKIDKKVDSQITQKRILKRVRELLRKNK